MTKRELGVLISRVFAVYVFVHGVERFGFIPFSDLALSVALMPSGVLLVLSGVLWLAADLLADALFPRQEEEAAGAISIGLSFDDVRTIAFSTIGLVVCVGAVSEAVGIVVAYGQFLAQSVVPGGEFWSNNMIQRGVVLGVKTVVGLGLLLGCRGVSGVLRRLRQADRSKSSS